MTSVKLIIFDLDDTLYHEEKYNLSGFKAVASFLSDKSDLSETEIFNQLKKDFEEGVRGNNFDLILEKLKLNIDVSELVKVYRSHIPDLTLYPEVKNVLNSLKENYSLVLMTDGYVEVQKNKIDALKIRSYFDKCIINDLSKGITKLSKKPFLKVLSEFKVQPEEVVMVGDNSKKDFVAANSLGIKTVMVGRDKGEYKDVDVSDEMRAKHQIKNLDDLHEILVQDKINVLLTPSSSATSMVTFAALKKDPSFRIVTTDVDHYSPGLYLADKPYVVPKFDDKKFLEVLENIIIKEKIDVVIPTIDPILSFFSKNKTRIEKTGAKLLLSSTDTIENTQDKWKTYEKLKDVLHCAKSFIDKKSVNIDFPLLIKPRAGSSSKDVFKVENQEQLDFFLSWIEKPIVQEYLPGKEYTVDCLADRDGKLLVSISRERLATKAGISVKGKIVKNKALDEMAEKIADNIKLFGPFCFQAKEDNNGTPKLIEINPRISGTMSLSVQSGANIQAMACKIAMGQKVTIPKLKTGIHMSRYWEDMYFTETKPKNIEVAK